MTARIPRKKGQPAKSDKHSDLYTDEDPKGTIKGLGFKNKRVAALSVAKIRRSNRTHAHKTQAAIAMEQRAKVAGKIFRIGHLGDFNELMLAGTLAGVEMGLMKSKIPYKKGGILKALDYLC